MKKEEKRKKTQIDMERKRKIKLAYPGTKNKLKPNDRDILLSISFKYLNN